MKLRAIGNDVLGLIRQVPGAADFGDRAGSRSGAIAYPGQSAPGRALRHQREGRSGRDLAGDRRTTGLDDVRRRAPVRYYGPLHAGRAQRSGNDRHDSLSDPRRWARATVTVGGNKVRRWREHHRPPRESTADHRAHQYPRNGPREFRGRGTEAVRETDQASQRATMSSGAGSSRT